MLRELIALEDHSKVWIYQANRELNYDEIDWTRAQIFAFVDRWTSHHKDVLGYGNIFHKRFIGLFVDETVAATSGCSIDSSVAFIKSLGEHLQIDFFERMTYAYLEEEDVNTISHGELSNAYKDKLVNDNTLFFDNLVKTKGDFLQSWLKPLGSSWHSRFL